MAKDVRIIPASGEVNFQENGVEKVSVYQSGNDIHIAPVGSVYLGDGTAANLQLGDVSTAVDIELLGGGSITSNGGALAVGQSGDVVNLNVTGVTYNLPQINAQSLQGYTPSSFALATHSHSISNITGLQTALDGKVDDSQVLTNVPSGAVFTDTVYTHPTTSGNKHIPSGGSAGQILRWSADGTATWGSDNNTTYSAATSTVGGLIELFSDTVQTTAANSVTTTASRTYGIQVNSAGQAVVNVPWTDNNTTYSQATTTTLGLIKLGDATAQTVAANSVTTTASRTYAIQVNASGQAVVNVPWTDNNTTYSAATTSTLGLIKIEDATVQTVAAAAVSATASRTYGIQVNSSGQAVVNVPWTDTDTTYTTFNSTSEGLVPASGGGDTIYLNGDGGWSTPTDTTYSAFTNTAAGLAPASGGGTTKYLRADGTWQVPPDTNTTYAVFTSTANGLAPLSGGGTTKYLRADGTWVVPPDTNTTYSQATATALGLIKLGDATAQTVAANSVTTTASRTYAVQVNASGQAVVNVPWSDTNTTYSAGSTTSLGLIKIEDATVQTVAAQAVSATANRTYGLQLNSSGQGVINVPWTDTDTTYTDATQSASGLMSSADKIKLDGIDAGANAYTYTLPIATATALGGIKVGSNLSINATSGVLDATNTTYSVFTSTANGLAPSSGGGTTKYLRADGTWQVPPDTNTDTKWDGGATGLVAATGRTSLGLGTAATSNVGDFATASHNHDSSYAKIQNSAYYVEAGGTTGNFTATVSEVTALYDGLTLMMYAAQAFTSNNYMNLNGLGAKQIYLYNTSKLTTHYPQYSVLRLVYNSTKNGGCWFTDMYYDSTDDYRIRWNNTITFGVYTHGYQLMLEGIDGKFYPVTEGGSTGNTNTVSTAQLRIGGTMVYYDSATDIAANGTGGTTNLYQGYTTSNMEYWNNVDAGWATPYVPFYLVGTIEEGNYLKLDNTTYTSFLTQTLPTTDDGKVYIYVGIMNNNYDSFRLDIDHSMYEFKDGSLRKYIPNHTHPFSSITSTPTTLSGYGITDAATSAQGAKADSALQSIAANSIGATELNVSGNGTTAQYLRSDADGSFTWATPTNTTYSASTGLTLTGTAFSVTANGIGATQLNVSGNGTTAQYLRSDGDGSFTWATPTNTTYSAGQGLSLSGTTFSTNGGWTGNIDIPGTGQLTVSAGIITDFTPA